MVKIERTFPAPNSLATEAKKNSGKYDDGIIDCCVQDPEEMINFKLVGEDVVVMAKDVTDDKAALTAALVYDVFNLRNTGMRVYKSEVRF